LVDTGASMTRILPTILLYLLCWLPSDTHQDQLQVEGVSHMEELLESLFIQQGRSPRQIQTGAKYQFETTDTVDTLDPITVIDPQEIARFNNYMDAIYRRMNAALRAKLMDPMVLNMNTRANKDTEGENINKKKRVERETGEGEHGNIIRKMEEIQGDKMNIMEEVDIVSIDRMGETSHDFNVKKNVGKVGKKALKKKRGNKKVKKNKSNLGDVRAKSEERKVKIEEKIKLRLDKKKTLSDKEVQEEGGRESRSKHNKNNKNNKKNKINKNKEKNIKGKGKGGKRNKGGAGEGRKEGERSGDSMSVRGAQSLEKSIGSVSGIATLRRAGDVTVTNDGNHKIVQSSFHVGPLELEVSKTYGHGKGRVVRTAQASTALMSGTMLLKVKPDGRAHVKKVVFQKPEQVSVLGSISDPKKRSDSYLKNSVNKLRPIAAQRILKTARYVLKAPSTVEKNN